MNDLPELLLGGLILLPLVAALAAVVAPRAGGTIVIGIGVAMVIQTAMLACHVFTAGTMQVQISGLSAPLGIGLRLDGLAALMLVTTAVTTSAVTLYARSYFAKSADRHSSERFWPLLCLMWAALNALFCSRDVFNLYVTLELLGFAAVLLVAMAGHRAALVAAMRYLLVSLCGSLLYLLGVALVYSETATVDLTLLAERLADSAAANAALLSMTIGLVMKAALFPMHFWLPPAHGNAPAPVSALLSALVVKAAFYILLRLWLEALQSPASAAASQVLGALGTSAILWGSIQALRQVHLKSLVAYSTVAQLGYLFLVFPLTVGRGAVAEGTAYGGVALLFVGHAFAKTAMFLVAGNLLHTAGHDRIADLDGQVQALPLSSFAFALAGLSLVGLPPSLGFAGKWSMLSAALAQQQWWWAASLLVGGLLTAAYLLKVFVSAFSKVESIPASKPLPLVMECVPLALALMAAALGLVAHWPAGLALVGAPW